MAERHIIDRPPPSIFYTLVVLLLTCLACHAFAPVRISSSSQPLSLSTKQTTRQHGEEQMSQKWRPSVFANLDPSLKAHKSNYRSTSTLSPSPMNLFSVSSHHHSYPSPTKALLSLAFASASLSKSPERGTSLFGATNDEGSEEGKKLSPFQKAVNGLWKAINSVLRFFFVKPLLWLKSLFSSSDATEKDDTEEMLRNTTATNTVVVENVTDAEMPATSVKAVGIETVDKEVVVNEEVIENATATDESANLETTKVEAQTKLGAEKKDTKLVEDDEETYLTTAENLAVDEDLDDIPYFATVVERAVATAKDAMAVIEQGVTSISDAMETSEKDDESMPEKHDDTEATAEKAAPLTLPKGERWAVANPDVDLSGDWKVVITDDFKSQYDDYLRNLGQPQIVRSVALSIIGMTREHTSQKDDGRKLYIKGTNARGLWERTLKASGSDFDGALTDEVSQKEEENHKRFPLITADDENVEAEAWWENNGTVHTSWLRGGKKYGGGDFETKRYLEGNGKYLVCESTFHPYEEGRAKATVTWRFERV